MEIQYANTKEVECYKNYVLDPANRKNVRAFSKMFGIPLLDKAKKLHDRLKQCNNVGEYNSIVSGDNKIEIKQGCKDNECLIFKVRLDRSYRKFFNYIKDGRAERLLKKDWQGDFKIIRILYVVAINKHDYKSI